MGLAGAGGAASATVAAVVSGLCGERGTGSNPGSVTFYIQSDLADTRLQSPEGPRANEATLKFQSH